MCVLEANFVIYKLCGCAKEIISYHNALQGYLGALLNGYWFFTCMPANPETTFATYLYFINKLMDLIETFFFVLRKKPNQVSVLHVYHHIAISVGTYMSLFMGPGMCLFI